jgi:hypothetical protein
MNSWFKKRKSKIFEKMEDHGLQTDYFYFEVGVMIIRMTIQIRSNNKVEAFSF